MKSKRGCVISLWYALLFFFMFFALEAFLLRRLLTDLRGGDLFGRYRYPLRVEYVPQISQICTDFSWEVLVTQISQMTQIFFIGYFYSSDFTELIRRFLAMSITHGFTRRRPARSLQIPPESGICPTDFTDLHRFFLLQFPSLPSLSSISHFSLLTSLSLFTFLPLKSLFTFLLFYLFTFKKAAAKK
jgi:hypothetical protein